MPFLRPGSAAPWGTSTDEFLLEPLRTSHVRLDYEAVMGTRGRLRQWSMSEWPADDFTLEGNFGDLEMHQREHEQQVAFTYTILTPDRATCLGCVYTKSLSPRFEDEHAQATGERPRFAARTAFWVRESRLADGLDRRVLAELMRWFSEEWEVDRAVFFTSDQEQRQQRCLTEAGLHLAYRVKATGGYYLAYL